MLYFTNKLKHFTNKLLNYKINDGGVKMIEEMFYRLPWNERIRIFRVGNRWTQVSAGKKCCTNAKNYWAWEAGKRYPRSSNRKLIAKAFGLKVEHLFSENDKL
jgi:DNA-binding XRE family transcriptional regulator